MRPVSRIVDMKANETNGIGIKMDRPSSLSVGRSIRRSKLLLTRYKHIAYAYIIECCWALLFCQRRNKYEDNDEFTSPCAMQQHGMTFNNINSGFDFMTEAMQRSWSLTCERIIYARSGSYMLEGFRWHGTSYVNACFENSCLD